MSCSMCLQKRVSSHMHKDVGVMTVVYFGLGITSTAVGTPALGADMDCIAVAHLMLVQVELYYLNCTLVHPEE